MTIGLFMLNYEDKFKIIEIRFVNYNKYHNLYLNLFVLTENELILD